MQILSHGFSVALYFVKSKAASLLWPWRGGGQRTTKSSAYTHCFLSTPKINVGDNHRSSEAPEEEAAWRCRQAGPIVPGCCGLAEPEHRKPSLRPDDVFCYVCFSSRQPVFSSFPSYKTPKQSTLFLQIPHNPYPVTFWPRCLPLTERDLPKDPGASLLKPHLFAD